jgi:hypothetical protein
MTLRQFAIHYRYSAVCPVGYNPARWRAMVVHFIREYSNV